MGIEHSKPSKLKIYNQNAGISTLNLPEHTNNPSGIASSGVVFSRTPSSIKSSLPNRPQKWQFTNPNDSLYPEQDKHYQSPYDALKISQTNSAVSFSGDKLRQTNQSVDSVRETHLNQNIKKSDLREAGKKKPVKCTKSKLEVANRPDITQNFKAYSALNFKINVKSSYGSVAKTQLHQMPTEQQKDEYQLPSQIDDMRTIRMTGGSNRSFLSMSGNTKIDVLLKSGGSADKSLQENFDIPGQQQNILPETDLGEKKVSETTAPESIAEETTVNNKIVEWIADYLCGPKPEDPEGEIQIKKSCDCEWLKKNRSQAMMQREVEDNFELPTSYKNKKWEFESNGEYKELRKKNDRKVRFME